MYHGEMVVEIHIQQGTYFAKCVHVQQCVRNGNLLTAYTKKSVHFLFLLM